MDDKEQEVPQVKEPSGIFFMLTLLSCNLTTAGANWGASRMNLCDVKEDNVVSH